MGLLQKTAFCHKLPHLFDKFHHKNLLQILDLNVPTTQLFMYTLFVRACVLFEGTFSLWVFLNKIHTTFYKQHFYKQHQAEIDKKISKS